MENKIIHYIVSELHDGQSDIEIAPDEDLLASGLVESMGMMRLIQFIEEEFELKVAPQDMTIENFMTVEAMANFIKAKKEIV